VVGWRVPCASQKALSTRPQIGPPPPSRDRCFLFLAIRPSSGLSPSGHPPALPLVPQANNRAIFDLIESHGGRRAADAGF